MQKVGGGLSSTGLGTSSLSGTGVQNPMTAVRNGFNAGMQHFNNDYGGNGGGAIDNHVDKSNRVVGFANRGPTRRRLGGLASTATGLSATGSTGLGAGLSGLGTSGTGLGSGLGASRLGGGGLTGLSGLGATGISNRISGYGHSGHGGHGHAGHSGYGGGGSKDGPVIVMRKKNANQNQDNFVTDLFEDLFPEGLDYETFAFIFGLSALAAGVLLRQLIINAGRKRRRSLGQDIVDTADFLQAMYNGKEAGLYWVAT